MAFDAAGATFGIDSTTPTAAMLNRRLVFIASDLGRFSECRFMVCERGRMKAAPSKGRFCRDQKLHSFNGRVAVERKGKVDMNDITEARAAVAEAQAEAQVS